MATPHSLLGMGSYTPQCSGSWCPAILSSSLAWLGFKTQNLNVFTTSRICSLPWVTGSLHWLVLFVPGKQSPACAVHGFCTLATGKAETRLSSLFIHTCSLPAKGHLLAPTVPFVLGEDMCPLPKALQEEDQSFPVQPLRSLHHFVCAPGPELSFSPGAHKSNSPRNVVVDFQKLRP